MKVDTLNNFSIKYDSISPQKINNNPKQYNSYEVITLQN